MKDIKKDKPKSLMSLPLKASFALAITDLNANRFDEDEYETRILVFMNLVGPGEADSELRTETMEECSKFGRVLECLVVELPPGTAKEHEAVRVFVEFDDLQSAIHAQQEMNGRYFAGRRVSAQFCPLDIWQRRDLTAHLR
eukprot:jgi/Hompol1/3889/HPOL_003385-RA